MSTFGSTAFGEDAFGADGSNYVVASATFNAGTIVLGGAYRSLADAFITGDMPYWFDLPNLIESLVLTGSPTAYFTARGALADSAAFSDTLDIAWRLLLADGITIVIGAIVDTLVASGAALSRLDAMAAVTAALALETLVTNGWTATLTDSAAFADALTQTARMIAPLVEAAVMADGATHTLRILGLITDSMAGVDTPLALLTAGLAASDGLLMYATVRLDGNDYAGWVLNTENKAPSQYTNFDFESLCFASQGVFKGRAFGAGAGGVYELTGDDDDGTDIDAYVRTGLVNIARGKLARVPDIYIGYTGDGDIVIKTVTTAASGAKVEDWFRGVLKPATDVAQGRIDLGPGLESVFWQFEIHNTGGEPLDLSSVQLRPVTTSRRI
jgi:hypothetical protein